MKECGDQPEKTPARAWLLAFNRPITKTELESAVSFLGARQRAPEGLASTPLTVSPNEDAVTELCLALFNANEFIFID